MSAAGPDLFGQAHDEFAPRADTPETATLDEQIGELEREIRMRRGVYPRWVREGRMASETAQQRIGALLAARRSLIGLRDGAAR